MKERGLLLNHRIRPTMRREYVKERRNVYLLTLMDIFTRKVLGYRVARSISKHEVADLVDEVILKTALPREVTIRTDNGSQFIAHKLRDYLKEIEIKQEFTHVSSPRENGYWVYRVFA